MIPTSMPRSSLPSMTMMYGYRDRKPPSAKRLSAIRLSASMTPSDVGADVEDDPRGVVQRQFVDAVGGELHPADPVGAATGHDLDAAVAGPPDQPAPVLPQPGELRRVAPAQPEPLQLAQDVVLDAAGVDRLFEELADPLVRLEHRPPLGPGPLIQRAGPVEEVLHVVAGDAHYRSLLIVAPRAEK